MPAHVGSARRRLRPSLSHPTHAPLRRRAQDNLRREQRAVMDLNCTTTSKILFPIQSALYMLEVYPQHCDALALVGGMACDSALVAGL